MLKLVQDIKSGIKNFDDMSREDLGQLISASVANGDYSALERLTNIHTGIYDYNLEKPWWLLSDFDARVWHYDFTTDEKKENKKQSSAPKLLDWGAVILDDGLPLTDPKHRKLLNSFKHWLIAVDNPLENGGVLSKANIASRKFNNVLHMINAVLLNSEYLQLSTHHFQKMDVDFWESVLVKIIINDGTEGIYDIDKRLKELLDEESKGVTDEEAEQFAQRFPHIKKSLIADDIKLNLNNRIKACAWLVEKGFYRGKDQIKETTAKGQTGRGAALIPLLFDGKLIFNGFQISTYPELWLSEPTKNTEYTAVENKDVSDGLSSGTINGYIDAARLVYANLGRNDAAQPYPPARNITTKGLQQVDGVKVKGDGRTRTLPPELIFNLIGQCYEFAKENLPMGASVICSRPNILHEILEILQEAREKSTKSSSNINKPQRHHAAYIKKSHDHLSDTERGHWYDYEAIACVSDEYINRGIKQIRYLNSSVSERHEKIRRNESLFELFDVLQGALQILVGAIMARRQDELVSLKSHGNLSPNLDPFTNKKTEYRLRFKVKKTGVGGKQGGNEIIERPISRSIARLIWQLEQFNIEAINRKLNKGKLSLFNNLIQDSAELSSVSHNTYNSHLDCVCDYFETELVEYETGEVRRNYIRQHQLRRFFALVFFWSKRHRGMDTLRWMLAHSSMEHLHRYISKDQHGGILTSAKATTITNALSDSNSELYDTEEVEKLRKIIAQRVLGDENKLVEISSMGNLYDDYAGDESYQTMPDIEQIRLNQAIETEVIRMLEGDQITLEPEFFTITKEDGKQAESFNLIIKIKDLD